MWTTDTSLNKKWRAHHRYLDYVTGIGNIEYSVLQNERTICCVMIRHQMCQIHQKMTHFSNTLEYIYQTETLTTLKIAYSSAGGLPLTDSSTTESISQCQWLSSPESKQLSKWRLFGAFSSSTAHAVTAVQYLSSGYSSVATLTIASPPAPPFGS